MSAKAFFSIAVLGLLAAAPPVLGQTTVWTTSGPLGGNIYCLVSDPADPDIVYVGTDFGVFKSNDGGQSWTASSNGLPAVRVSAITLDPSSSTTIYVGTETPAGVSSAGLFKSTDGGASWGSINTGLIDPTTGVTPLDIEALAADPAHQGWILAGTRFSEIFKSEDNGATWEPVTLGGYDLALETSSFAFDPTNSSRIYAASTQGLLLSTDEGDDWEQFGDAGVTMYRVVVDPSNSQIVYAANVAGSGLLKSTNAGSHWGQINNGVPQVIVGGVATPPGVTALTIDPNQPSTLYAGTYGSGFLVTSNGGSNWTTASNGMRVPYIGSITFRPGQNSSIYAATYGGGVYQSSDSAATWQATNTGLDLSLVAALVATPQALYAGTFDGVHTSTDGGGSWQESSNGLPAAPIGALALVPGATPTLFAGTLGGGLYNSTDGGATWSSHTSGLDDSYIGAFAADPTNPATMYAGTDDANLSDQAVYKSTDSGATWERTPLNANSATINSITINPKQSSTVLAVNRGGSTYFQSTDGGSHWSTITPNANCGQVNTLLFDPTGATLYLGGTFGVCNSTDGGKTWTVSSISASTSVLALLFDPNNASILYAGASPLTPGGVGGVWESMDGGQTWQAVGTGFQGAAVSALAIDPSGALHAGTQGGGVAELQSISQDRQPIHLPAPGNRETRNLGPR